MEWYFILLIVVGIIVLIFCIFVLPFLLYTLKIAKKVYFKFLVREPKEKWGRECSDTSNIEQVTMYETGIKWSLDKNFIDVSITSEGFRLVGKYLDNNSSTCVIIIPGRTESLLYSYYFSIPYYNHGTNVLVIDNRSHGESDGYFDTIGVDEYKDIQAWAKLLKNKFNNKKIILHGICIGAATAVFACAKQDEDLINCIVADGLFTNFYDIFKNHMIADHHPVFPVCKEVMYYLKKYTKADIYKECPLNYLPNINIPILFLYSDEDKFVLDDMKKKVFAACKSNNKERNDFKKGAHSHIRINQPEQYDKTIDCFLTNHDL